MLECNPEVATMRSMMPPESTSGILSKLGDGNPNGIATLQSSQRQLRDCKIPCPISVWSDWLANSLPLLHWAD